MAAHLRWRLVDPFTAEEYQFFPNPDEMSSPFPEKPIEYQTTTAIGGQPIVWQGNTPPKDWTFGGHILDPDQYEALRSWVYDKNTRLYLYDHFGRRLTVVLRSFNPTPRRAVGRYWKHRYEISAVVLQIGPPTVGEVPV